MILTRYTVESRSCPTQSSFTLRLGAFPKEKTAYKRFFERLSPEEALQEASFTAR
jgi:hypothetical protein